ncbi:NTP pyrophosphohydrolase [Streptomyces sp. AC495_CC817]|uniref:NTP pyrophosphohydrolase n=1 Tax=Streptomyces sp. AC495_CC817 TaxID=2823900 RepID=UPI0020B794A0
MRELLEVRPALVVDAANVVGSVPDGWWKDRAGAAARLRDRLSGVAVPAEDLDLDATAWFPEVALVVEGQARAIAEDSGAEALAESPAEGAPVAGVGSLAVIAADAAGDDAIVDVVAHRVAGGALVVAVTSDRELQARVSGAGARFVRSSGWLRDLLDREA